MLVYRRLNMSEQFFVNSQYMSKSFSSCLPFSSPSLNGVWLIHHNSSEIVAKRVAFSFEGLEETFGECFFSRSKKQTVYFPLTISVWRQSENEPAEIPIEEASLIWSFTILFNRQITRTTWSSFTSAKSWKIKLFPNPVGRTASKSPPVNNCFTEDFCSCRSSRLNPRSERKFNVFL